MLMFDYALILEWYPTPSGCLVDRLPYSCEWVDGLHD